MPAYPANAQRYQDKDSAAYAYMWQQNSSHRMAVYWPNRKAPVFYAFFKDADEAVRQMQMHFANYRRQHPWK